MATKRQENIAELMSALGKREVTALEVSAIENSIKPELDDRKKKGIVIKNKTKEGKKKINTRLAAMVNELIRPKTPITAEDIGLYRRCWADEFSERTGKCAWGFKELRERLGYDPVTGKER
jgi:hypothetical protein